jgi:ATP-binding cassette, subfamily F, member 3
VNDDGADEMTAGIEMFESLRSDLDNLGAGGTEARARVVLLGLGFTTSQIEGPFSALSGGWRTRCDLACALLQNTDILLLDEPTNYLDLPAVIWLQQYISESLKGKTVVVVTHDRDFADAVAEELILLRLIPAKSIETFRGNLTEYENEKRRQINLFRCRCIDCIQCISTLLTSHHYGSCVSFLSGTFDFG